MQHATDNIERLEELPTKKSNKTIRNEGWGRHLSKTMPWTKATKWVESFEGRSYDEVLSKWVHLPWIPVHYRNVEGLDRIVQEARVLDGVLCNRWNLPMGDFARTIYVHPETKCIVVHKPKKRTSWYKQKAAEQRKRCIILGDGHQLIKLKGIWYEVKYSDTDLCRAVKYGFRTRTPITEIDSFYLTINYKHQLNAKELKKHNLKND